MGTLWKVLFALIFLGLSRAEAQLPPELQSIPITSVSITEPGPRRHTSGVNFVAISPDGKYLLSRDYNYPRVWNIQTGESVFDSKDSFYLVGAIRFTADSRSFTGLHLSNLCTVDIQSMDIKNQILLESNSRYGLLNFSGDGSRLLYSDGSRSNYEGDFRGGRRRGQNLTINVREASTGKIISHIFDSPDYITNAALSPDGTRVVTRAMNGAVKIWNADTGMPLQQWEPAEEIVKSRSDYSNITFSPDGIHVAISQINMGMRIYKVETGTRVMWWDSSTGPTAPLVFAHKSPFLYAKDNAGAFSQWDTVTGIKKKTFVGHVGNIQSITIGKDDKTLATGGQDGSVRIWDALTGEERLPHKGHTGEIAALGLGYRNQWFASAGADMTVRIRDPNTGAELVPPLVLPREYSIMAMAVHPHDPVIAISFRHSVVLQWNWATRQSKQLHTNTLGSVINKLEYSQDGRSLYALYNSSGIEEWTYPKGLNKNHTTDQQSHNSYSFHNGFQAADFNSDENIQKLTVDKFHNKKNAQISRKLSDLERIYDPHLTSDGRFVYGLINNQEGRNRTSYFDTKTLTRRLSLPVSNYDTHAHVFTRDGRYVLVCDDDNSSLHVVFELLTGTCVGILESPGRDNVRYLIANDLSFVLGVSFHGGYRFYQLKSDISIGDPSDSQWNSWYEKLQDKNGLVALAGIRNMVANPDKAVAFLRKEILLPQMVTDEKFNSLVNDLEHPVFATRQAALTQLKTLAPACIPMLTKLQQNQKEPEARATLYNLIREAADSEFLPTGQDLRNRRAVQVLEWIGTPEAIGLLRIWANAPMQTVFNKEAAEAYSRLTGLPPAESVKPVLTTNR